MKERLIFFLKFTLYWYFFFALSKLFFLLYHFKESFQLPLTDWFGVFRHGFRLDISTTGYILILPSLFIIFTSFFKGKLLFRLMNIYTLVLLSVIVILTMVDLELYSFWGFRLDTTPLVYMDNRQAMFASVTVFSIILSVVIIAGLVFFCYWIYLNLVASTIRNLKHSYLSPVIFIILAAALFIPIRGGFDVASVNLSSAYFHKNQFANHAAINCIWNVGYSLTELKNANQSYNFMSREEAFDAFNDLYIKEGKKKYILKTRNPNIIIITLESFTSKAIGCLGGRKGITPSIDRLANEGVLFDHFYASGDRTDKAMVALISAYPALPTTNIIKFPNKLKKQPSLNSELKSRNYHTAYYYGGNIDFANYHALLNMAGFEKIVTKNDFKGHANDSKWGAFDEHVLNKLLDDTPDEDDHFYKYLFTLTSHPPFDIPVAPLFKGSDDDSKFLSSIHYTDSCIGGFIESAKKKKWWNNTLIILVADHGVNLPGNTQNHEEAKFTIPMLWLGGALAVNDTIIHTYASQTDLMKTLCCQMDLPFKSKFSKNIFAAGSPSFAFYAFNNGFGFITENYKLIYSNITNNYIVKEGNYSEEFLKYGKAYLQVLSEDFIRK